MMTMNVNNLGCFMGARCGCCQHYNGAYCTAMWGTEGITDDPVVGCVQETKDYTQFKMLLGNREIEARRKERIRKSVKEKGQLFSPIIVNEKMEIIDGQTRFTVFMEEGLPIHYVMHYGLTLQDCITLNSASSVWKMHDYVGSYEAQGNTNYIFFKQLEQRHKGIPMQALRYSVTGASWAGNFSEDVKNGKIRLSEEDFEKADSLLCYAERFIPEFKGGNKGYFLIAVMFSRDVKGVDPERLFEKWCKFGSVKSVYARASTIFDALGALERAYNYKSRADDVVYLQAEYDKFCRSQYAGYGARWADKRTKK